MRSDSFAAWRVQVALTGENDETRGMQCKEYLD